MTKTIFIILPHQLFSFSRLETLLDEHMEEDDNFSICCIEEPFFFYDAARRPFRTHRLKLAFHRASMRAHFDGWKERYPDRANYVPYDSIAKSPRQYERALGYDGKDKPRIFMIDPHDRDVMDKYKNIFGSRLQVGEDKYGFLMTRRDLDAFHQKHVRNKKSGSGVQHATFFGFVKEKLGVLTKVESTDEQNRHALPEDFDAVPEEKKKLPAFRDAYHDEARKYVQEHPRFSKDHYGVIRDDVWHTLAIDHAQAKTVLDCFIRTRLSCFGKYQDALHQDYRILFHSQCAYLLNAGLLCPRDMLDRVLDAQKKKNARVHINDVEGFVRQLIGWREYMRYIYEYFGPGSSAFKETRNIFGNDRGIVDVKKAKKAKTASPAWYEGKLGVSVLDEEIRKVRDGAYAHHIVRLMVFLNFMVLCRVHHEDIIQWFMEMVALDAYAWVMWGNIVAMGFFDPRFMRKPYISTTNYLEEMGRGYRITQETKDLWSDLFYAFLVDNKEQVRKHAAFYTRNLSYWEKRSPEEREKRYRHAHDFIENFTYSKTTQSHV